MSINENNAPHNHIEINLSKNDGGPWVKVDGVPVAVERDSMTFSGGENDAARITLTLLPASLSVTERWV